MLLCVVGLIPSSSSAAAWSIGSVFGGTLLLGGSHDPPDLLAQRGDGDAEAWRYPGAHLRRVDRDGRPDRALEGRDRMVGRAGRARVLEGAAEQHGPVRAVPRPRRRRMVRRAGL